MNWAAVRTNGRFPHDRPSRDLTNSDTFRQFAAHSVVQRVLKDRGWMCRYTQHGLRLGESHSKTRCKNLMHTLSFTVKPDFEALVISGVCCYFSGVQAENVVHEGANGLRAEVKI